jgi:plasmid stabilization system protein ParE
MRRIVFAPSFSREAQFGEHASDAFISNLMAVCTLIARFPGIGKTDHNYTTDLTGFPLKHNWIFYETDHYKVRFIHIVASRRNRNSIRF